MVTETGFRIQQSIMGLFGKAKRLA